jgi:hypothetical protein
VAGQLAYEIAIMNDILTSVLIKAGQSVPADILRTDGTSRRKTAVCAGLPKTGTQYIWKSLAFDLGQSV